MTDESGSSIGDQRDQDFDEILSAPVVPKAKGRLIVLWVGVVALLAASVFAVTNLTASSAAGSPEAAVSNLFKAVSNEDLLGVLGALAPSERDVFKDDLLAILNDLKRIEVLSPDFEPSNVSGVDVEITDLAMDTSKLGGGVSKVTVKGGKAKGSVTPTDLPLGKQLRDYLSDGLSSKTETDSQDLADDDPFDLVTIQEDGYWFVSLAYTAAEAMRKESGQPAPSFGHSDLKAAGQASPEAAVEAILRAGAKFDVEGAIALIPPGEGRALRDYLPLFLPDLKDGAASMGDEVKVNISALELDPSTSGDVSVVSVKKLVADVDASGSATHVDIDGKCAAITVDGKENRQCAGEQHKDLGLPSIPGLSGFGETRLVAVREGGQWYVSPIRSVLYPVRLALNEMNKSAFQDLIDYFESFAGVGVSESRSLTVTGEAIQ